MFKPGYWKGELYTPDRVARTAANFARLRGHLTPVAKLGHDSDQALADRLKESLGFLGLGRVADAGLTDAGELWITLTGVPVDVGAQVNAGRLSTGSVELLPAVPDPADPARQIDGPVLTGVALLGEEQPAVKGFPIPRAVFPDGTEVPPAPDAAAWLAAMADVQRTFSAESRRARRLSANPAAVTLCFSDYAPLPEAPAVDQLLAQLKALPPDQLQMLLGQIQPGGTQMSAPGTAGGPPPGPATPPADDTGKQFAADGPLTMSAFSSFADECKKMFADLTGRVGAVEKFADEAQKKTDADATATATQMSEQVVDQAIKAGRVMPRDRGLFVEQGVKVLTTKAFADKTGPEAFAAWRADLDGRPTVALFRDAPAAKPKGAPAGYLDLLDMVPEGNQIRKKYAPAAG